MVPVTVVAIVIVIIVMHVVIVEVLDVVVTVVVVVLVVLVVEVRVVLVKVVLDDVVTVVVVVLSVLVVGHKSSHTVVINNHHPNTATSQLQMQILIVFLLEMSPLLDPQPELLFHIPRNGFSHLNQFEDTHLIMFTHF